MLTRLRALLLILPLLMAGSGWADSPASGLLDGLRFVGINGPKGSPLNEGEKEEIVFEQGHFFSVYCVPYDFEKAPYSAHRDGNQIHFEATTHSPSHGSIHWRGTVTGDSAVMTFTWTKERWYWNTRREYWFEGRLKR